MGSLSQMLRILVLEIVEDIELQATAWTCLEMQVVFTIVRTTLFHRSHAPLGPLHQLENHWFLVSILIESNFFRLPNS